jgi:hypothetical protein
MFKLFSGQAEALRQVRAEAEAQLRDMQRQRDAALKQASTLSAELAVVQQTAQSLVREMISTAAAHARVTLSKSVDFCPLF